jgi:hypothetical protein
LWITFLWVIIFRFLGSGVLWWYFGMGDHSK